MGKDYVTSSGVKTSSAAITSDGAMIYRLILHPGSAVSVASLRDGGASGTILVNLKGAANDSSITLSFDNPVPANTSLYLEISGTGAEAIALYSRQ